MFSFNQKMNFINRFIIIWPNIKKKLRKVLLRKKHFYTNKQASVKLRFINDFYTYFYVYIYMIENYTIFSIYNLSISNKH